MNALRLPEQLQPLLLRELRARRANLDPATLTRLQKMVKRDAIPCYEEDAAAFAYLYFGANYVKAYRASQRVWNLRRWRSVRVLDLGCGAGASTAGVVQGLWDSGACVEHVAVIDCSPNQLELFRCTTSPWLNYMAPALTVSCVRDVVAKFPEYAAEFDLIVVSYVLCELGQERADFDFDLKTHASTVGKELVVIDSDSTTGKPAIWSRSTGVMHLAAEELHVDVGVINLLGCEISPRYQYGSTVCH